MSSILNSLNKYPLNQVFLECKEEEGESQLPEQNVVANCVVDLLKTSPNIENLMYLMEQHPEYKLEDHGVDNCTALQVAVFSKKLDLLRKIALLRPQVANSVTGKHLTSTLVYATYHYDPKFSLAAAKTLLSAGAKINQIGNPKNTALNAAVCLGEKHIEVIKLLLKKGGVIYLEEEEETQENITLVLRAIGELIAPKMFANEQLSKSNSSPLERLPSGVKWHIASFLN